VLKPDVAAPGVEILAGDTPQHEDPNATDGSLFQVAEGTSMSSPHVAGAAGSAGAAPSWLDAGADQVGADDVGRPRSGW